VPAGSRLCLNVFSKLHSGESAALQDKVLKEFYFIEAQSRYRQACWTCPVGISVPRTGYFRCCYEEYDYFALRRCIL